MTYLNDRHKSDLRILKTQEKLREALGSLMTEKPFDSISVIEICEKANVRRATFYRHYPDKGDFLVHTLNAIADEMRNETVRKYGTENLTDYIIGYVREIFDFINGHRRLFDNVLESSALFSIYEISLTTTQRLLIDNFTEADKNREISFGTKLAAASFINGGIANMVISFFKQNDENVEEFFSQLRIILGKLLSE